MKNCLKKEEITNESWIIYEMNEKFSKERKKERKKKGVN